MWSNGIACFQSWSLRQSGIKYESVCTPDTGRRFGGDAEQIRMQSYRRTFDFLNQSPTQLYLFRVFVTSSFKKYCPVRNNLVSETVAGDAEILGVVALQMPQSCQRISEAEVDAIKVVCQHLAEALRNSCALVRTAKERANRQQYAAINFLGNCIGCADVNTMMISVCKELHSFINFDCAAVFTVKVRNSGSNGIVAIEQEWLVSHFSGDGDRLSAQLGILRVLGQEVLSSSSSIGPLVVDGPESAGNMFGHYQLARVVHSTKVSVRPAHGPKTYTKQPLAGCLFGVPLSNLQDDGSLHLCGSVVLIRDGHDSKSPLS
jgi:hypothetical protein